MRSRGTESPESIENEISRLNTVIIGYFSKIKVPKFPKKKIQSPRVNPSQLVILIKRFLRLKTLYEPLYKIPPKEIPPKYSEAIKELIRRYLLIKERFESGAYIL